VFSIESIQSILRAIICSVPQRQLRRDRRLGGSERSRRSAQTFDVGSIDPSPFGDALSCSITFHPTNLVSPVEPGGASHERSRANNVA
jgi:hypothetical protein